MRIGQGFVQDFRDVAGDAAIGRVTVPMLLPQTFARCLHTAIIIGYSTFLCWYWAPPSIAIAGVYGLAGTVMASLLTDYSVKADFRSYKLYNVSGYTLSRSLNLNQPGVALFVRHTPAV